MPLANRRKKHQSLYQNGQPRRYYYHRTTERISGDPRSRGRLSDEESISADLPISLQKLRASLRPMGSEPAFHSVGNTLVLFGANVDRLMRFSKIQDLPAVITISREEDDE